MTEAKAKIEPLIGTPSKIRAKGRMETASKLPTQTTVKVKAKSLLGPPSKIITRATTDTTVGLRLAITVTSAVQRYVILH